MKGIFCMALMLMATPAMAAGAMSNINQNINVKDATIRATSGHTGGSVEIFGFEANVGIDHGGGVSIGTIENNGGEMSRIQQTINAEGADILSHGAEIEIGTIKNK